MTRIDWSLSPAQRADARKALTLLDGTGVTLEEAARRALQGKRALRRVTVATAADEFLRTRLKLRASTAEWYERKLKHLLTAFGSRNIDDLDRPTLLEWLAALGASDGHRAAIARATRALWRWCLVQSPPLVTTDATIGFETTGPAHQGDAPFLTVAQVAAALAAAGPYRNAAALLFFAGIRPEEISAPSKPPLLWRHVRPDERMIRIPADIAKTGKPRIVEGLPDTLWRWLTPPAAARPDDPVSPFRVQQFVRIARAALELERWPHDATRHTFATYALALTGEPGKVATWLGHEGNPTMLHRHYRGLATKADAEKYFALRPSA